MQTTQNALTLFPEVRLTTSRIFTDERGFFRETFRENWSDLQFVQDNHSFSKKGVIRGMHFQRSPGQVKWVTVLTGVIFDVLVDVRKGSPTFGKWAGIYLDADKGDQLLIPVGFAHGFCVTSQEAHVLYKVSSYYNPQEERTFRYDDPQVGIAWPVEIPILSERDLQAPLLCEVSL